MSSGKKVTVGFWYYLGFHTVAGIGPVDEFTDLVVGQRLAWSGSLTGSGSILVDEPELFGGKKREGGVAGTFDILFGEDTQGVNDYLLAKQGAPQPAYRRLLSIVARQVLYSANNPYLKDFWFRFRRTTTREFNWYPAKVDIGGHMNPSHLIVDCLTDSDWGAGLAQNLLDLDSFTNAADTLFTEGFGLSFLWTRESTLLDFLQEVVRHVQGALYVAPDDGRIRFDLIRRDYVVASLPLFDESNIIDIDSWEEMQIGDTINELRVNYTNDADGEVATTAPLQNLGNIQAQGKVISQTVSYPGVYDPDIAARLAARDLKAASGQLTQARIKVNRDGWYLRPGGALRLSWVKLGVTDRVFRVVDIDPGTPEQPEISLSLIQDVHDIPASTYVAAQPPLWVSPEIPLTDIGNWRLQEVPYYDVATTLTPSQLGDLDPDYGFVQAMAEREGGTWLGYDMLASADDLTFVERATGLFTPYATLAANITELGTALTYANATDTSLIELATYAYLIQGASLELVEITAHDPGTASLTVKRGILDTIPKAFSIGAALWFPQNFNGLDETERVVTELVYYKLLPYGAGGALAEASATSQAITLDNRAQRPYPPANVQLDAGYFPASSSNTATLTWAHRDRTQQTAGYNGWTEASIGPEPGVTYTVDWYDDDTETLKQSTASIAGTSDTFLDSPGVSYNARVEIKAVRGSYDSWQVFSHVFAYSTDP